jgi:hypothetical protein
MKVVYAINRASSSPSAKAGSDDAVVEDFVEKGAIVLHIGD